MTVPSHTKKINRKVGRDTDYDYSAPARQRPRVNITNYHTIKKILNDTATLSMCWNNTQMLWPEGGQRFMLGGDEQVHKDRRSQMAKCRLMDCQWCGRMMLTSESQVSTYRIGTRRSVHSTKRLRRSSFEKPRVVWVIEEIRRGWSTLPGSHYP